MKVTSKQAAKLLGTSSFSIVKGLEFKTLDIGWFTRQAGAKRGTAHIVPERLAAYLHISLEELENRLTEIK